MKFGEIYDDLIITKIEENINPIMSMDFFSTDNIMDMKFDDLIEAGISLFRLLSREECFYYSVENQVIFQ